MKRLSKYISHMKDLHSLNEYLNERLVINKNYSPYTCAPKSWKELREIIENRYNKLGAGTEHKPIDFNDIDVSNIDSFWDENTETGIFEKIAFEYIDVSNWDVSNVKDTSYMFDYCENLKFVGDLSTWNVSNVEDMGGMFFGCEKLKSIGDLSDWDVSNVEYMNYMFYDCEKLKSVGNLSNWKVSKVKDMSGTFRYCSKLKSVGDLSDWDVSNVEYMSYMFLHCEKIASIGNLSNWDVSNVKDMDEMFKDSGITNTPNWYKG